MIPRYKRPVGWRRESYRHYLAAKGIRTRYFSKFGDIDKNIKSKEDINERLRALARTDPERFKKGKFTETIPKPQVMPGGGVNMGYENSYERLVFDLDQRKDSIRSRKMRNEANIDQPYISGWGKNNDIRDALLAAGEGKIIEPKIVLRDYDGLPYEMGELRGKPVVKTDVPNVFYESLGSKFNRGEYEFAKEIAKDFPDKKIVISMGPYRSYAVESYLDKDVINLDFYSAGPIMNPGVLGEVKNNVKALLRFQDDKMKSGNKDVSSDNGLTE